MEIILGYLLFCLVISAGSGKRAKISAFLIFVAGVFINGFRSVSFAIDNPGYVSYFAYNSKFTLSESWAAVTKQIGKDPFYYFVGNLFSKMGFSYRGWFVFIAVVYMGGFCYLMYKYSKNYFLSLLFLVSQTYFYFSMSGLRQTLAMGICFFAFDFAYRKKLIPFLLCVLLAAAFHSSALIFLLLYPMKNMRIGPKQGVLVFVGLGLAMFAPRAINQLIETLAWSDSMADYAAVTTGLSSSGFIIQMFVLAFCIYFMGFDKEGEKARRPWLNAMFLGLFFQAFVINIDNMFRISMYFSVYGAIAIPEAISLQKDLRNKRILYWAVIALLLLYMMRSSRWSEFTMFGGI